MIQHTTLVRAIMSLGYPIFPCGLNRWQVHGKLGLISWYISDATDAAVKDLHFRKWSDIRSDNYYHDPKYLKSIEEVIKSIKGENR